MISPQYKNKADSIVPFYNSLGYKSSGFVGAVKSCLSKEKEELSRVTENYVKHHTAAASGISSSSHEVSSSSSDDNNNDDVLMAFASAIPSKGTKKDYLIRLRYFFDALHVPWETLADQASNFLSQIAAATSNNPNPNPKYAQDCLEKFKRYLKDRFERGELSGGSVKNYLFAPKLFYEVNDIDFDWKRIRRGSK